MRKMLCALAMIIGATQAGAQTNDVAFLALSVSSFALTLTDKQYLFCASMGRSAEDIMLARQEGLPFESIMGIMDNPESHQVVRGMKIGWVMQAYGFPIFETPENKQNAIRDFSHEKHLDCIKHSAYGLDIY